MRHKLLIGWAITLISVLLIGIFLSIAFGISLVLSIMMPIQIGVATTIVPLSIIDYKIEHIPNIGKKKKSRSKQYKELDMDTEIKIDDFKKKNKRSKVIETDKKHTKEDIIILEDIHLDDFDDEMKEILEDIQIVEISEKPSDKSSLEIAKNYFINDEILKIFDQEESLKDAASDLKQFELYSFSPEFYEKMNEFNWSEKDQRDFIEDMLHFSPSERMEIVNNMIEKSKS